MIPWNEGRLCGFDLETTGVDVEADRIVTSCVVRCGGDQPAESTTWLADPGIEIPAEAAKVHGVTTERARAEGRPAAEVIEEIATALAQAVAEEIPLVIMNAPFDLTLLDRECRRHGVTPLVDRIGGAEHLRVIDPAVIDGQLSRRRGKRTLSHLCEYYRVRIDGAHASDADAIAACRVAWRLGQRYPRIGRLEVRGLHLLQIGWAADRAESRAAYFARTPGKEHLAAGVRTEWPLIPFTTVTATAEEASI